MYKSFVANPACNLSVAGRFHREFALPVEMIATVWALTISCDVLVNTEVVKCLSILDLVRYQIRV